MAREVAADDVVVQGAATMNLKHKLRRCAYCKKLFSPDPRCRFHQRFCSEAACRVASRAATQRKWRAKPENLWYRRREEILAKSAGQRPNNAGLGQATLRDEKLPDDPVIVGLFAVLRGSTLPSQIVETYRSVLATGREILRMQRSAGRTDVAPARTAE